MTILYFDSTSDRSVVLTERVGIGRRQPSLIQRKKITFDEIDQNLFSSMTHLFDLTYQISNALTRLDFLQDLPHSYPKGHENKV